MKTQTNYSDQQDALRVGFIFDQRANELLSRTVEGAVLGFGMPVSQGTGDTARIMNNGPVAVEASVTVAAGDPVRVVVATGAFTNTGGVQIVGAQYGTSGVSGDLVKVRLA